ncbi:hypothetical protein HKD37_18G051632 [Glycine soja]
MNNFKPATCSSCTRLQLQSRQSNQRFVKPLLESPVEVARSTLGEVHAIALPKAQRKKKASVCGIETWRAAVGERARGVCHCQGWSDADVIGLGMKGRFWLTKVSRVRSSVWKVGGKRPGYNASDSESDELEEDS